MLYRDCIIMDCSAVHALLLKYIFRAATSLQRGQATLEGGSTVPEAIVTVLCTPDDGCGGHPKHVE